MTEQRLTMSIIQALTARRIWCWRVNSGVVVTGTGASRRMVKMAPAGTPDILGVVGDGRLFGLEVKTAKGRLAASQVAWAAKAVANGVRTRVVRSIGEALTAVAEWRQT